MKDWYVTLTSMSLRVVGGAAVTEVDEDRVYAEHGCRLAPNEKEAPIEDKECVVASILALDVAEALEKDKSVQLDDCLWAWVGRAENETEAVVYTILLTRRGDTTRTQIFGGGKVERTEDSWIENAIQLAKKGKER